MKSPLCLAIFFSVFLLPACSGDRDKDVNKGKDRPVPATPAPPEKK